MKMDSTKEDDLAAKREARRKRILENAKDRLTRITGREDDTEDSMETNQQSENKPKKIYPDPEIERDVYVRPTPQIPNELFAASGGLDSFDDQQQFFDLLNSLNQQQNITGIPSAPNSNSFNAFAQFENLNASDPNANPFFANANATGSTRVPDTPLKKFLKTKIHIGLLAILTYLLITIAQFNCSVFLIFLLWEITEIFILRQHESNQNGFINIVFMFAGISPTKINIILKWIQLLNKVLRDVAIFLFFFISSHICYSYWFELSLVVSGTQHQNIFTQKIIETTTNDDDFIDHREL